MSHIRRASALTAASLALCAAAEAQAGAFMLREGSAEALGASLAGRTAGGGGDDVSFAIHNPASLRGVRALDVSAGAAAVLGSGEGVADLPAAPPGLTLESDPNQEAVVPSFVAGWRATERLVVGLAVDSPFGLATEYDEDFIGAFDGVRSDLLTLTATPMVAYDPAPGITLAAGVMLQYADAELSNRIATGDVVDIQGDGFAVGFTAGAIAEVTPTTTIGLNFQTGFDHELEGEFSDDFPGFGGRGGRATFDLPALVSFGVVQEITSDLRVMAEAEWANWSAFDAIVIEDEESGAVVVDDPQNYEDSFMASLGAEYDVTDRFTVRGGVAYDKTPTRDRFRTVRVPDADRYWLSAGASYDITDSIGVDIGYTYIGVGDAEVTLRNPSGVEVDYDDSQVHVVALNVGYRF